MPDSARILGVDDNARNLDILRRTLAPEFPITTAASGEEALERAVAMRPDLILLDIMMPGIDGYETCRRIRSMPELVGTKIILVSAKALTSERLEGYAAGANDYIIKPFDQDELLAKVRVYLRLKSVEEVDGLKSDLLDLLSHETGTPLTGILGALFLLRDTAPLDAEQLELIDVAESSAVRMQRLVKRVSMVAELKAGTMPLSMTPLDLRALAATAIEESGEQATRQRVTVTLEGREPVPATGDGNLLDWVIGALVENAIRMSPPGSAVKLAVGMGEAGPTLSVTDQGPGIEPDLLPRIFQQFVVADIRHHQRGSGLSLAASQLILQRHGGSLEVQSEAGKGASFRLTLPCAVAARAAA